MSPILAGRSKGKQADKLPFMALQCLDTLLRLGRTCEGVAELLREVPAPGEAGPSEASTGAYCPSILPLTLWRLLCTFLLRRTTGYTRSKGTVSCDNGYQTLFHK